MENKRLKLPNQAANPANQQWRQSFIILFLLFCSFTFVHSQIKLNNVVLSEKGNPLPYSTVYNSSAHNGVITNEEGRFELNANPSDLIFIRCLGYQEYQNTVEQLQNIAEIILKEVTYSINELTITPGSSDAKKIVNKFRFNIPKNYPRKALQINGVYKEYSLIENEYSNFFQCDMDILVNSMASTKIPTFKTKVYGYKSYRNSDSNITTWHIIPEYNYLHFWLYRYSFLWNHKSYQYRLIGHTTYNKLNLMQINFYPLQPDKSVRQYTGTMYIDMKSYALVFLHYEMLPNEIDFSLNKSEIPQKVLKEDTKI